MCPILKFSRLKDVNLVIRPPLKRKVRGGDITICLTTRKRCRWWFRFGMQLPVLPRFWLVPEASFSSLFFTNLSLWSNPYFFICKMGLLVDLHWGWCCLAEYRVIINEPISGRQCYGQQSPLIVGNVVFLPLQSLRRIWPSWLVSKRLKKAVGKNWV